MHGKEFNYVVEKSKWMSFVQTFIAVDRKTTSLAKLGNVDMKRRQFV